jgi:hypothetical protein
MKPDWNQLIHRYIDGLATPEEASALEARLLEEPELRAVYLDCMNLDVALAAVADAQAVPAERATSRRSFWLRPFAAAAAGLTIGGLAASAVWAYAVPRPPAVTELPLVDAGFEATPTAKLGDVPSAPGEWSGDPVEIVGVHGAVKPHGGNRMIRFIAAQPGGDHVGSKPMASDLWQVVELPGSGLRTVKVRAWFNAESAKQARFHIMAVAGAGDPASGARLWAQRYSDSSTALASCRSMIFVDHNPATWEPGDMVLQVPAEARVLVIGLAAYRVPVAPPSEWFPGQFVDDVTVTMQEVAP